MALRRLRDARAFDAKPRPTNANARKRPRSLRRVEKLERRCLMASLSLLNPAALEGANSFRDYAPYSPGLPGISPLAPANYAVVIHTSTSGSEKPDSQGTLAAPLQFELMPGPGETNGEMGEVALTSAYYLSSAVAGSNPNAGQAVESISETVSWSGQQKTILSVQQEEGNYQF